MKLKSSMKTSPILLLAILASFTATGQAATTITALPFSIYAPGTYVLATDLTAPSSPGGAGAISISVPGFLPPGNVVLDLQGHTIHSNNTYAGMSVSSGGYITIANGTLDGFGLGIEVNVGGGINSHLLIDNITFKSTKGTTLGISMTRTSRAMVSRCSFVGPMSCGISDKYSGLGNTYTNLNFDGKQSVNIQEGGTDGSSYPYPHTVNLNMTQTQP
jgi:hypothetical protein